MTNPAIALLLTMFVAAQEPVDPEQQQKNFREICVAGLVEIEQHDPNLALAIICDLNGYSDLEACAADIEQGGKPRAVEMIKKAVDACVEDSIKQEKEKKNI